MHLKFNFIYLFVFLLIINSCKQSSVNVISSSPTGSFIKEVVKTSSDFTPNETSIEINPEINFQQIEGWGGCFNELGWKALLSLSIKNRNEVIEALFDNVQGCAFTYCRMPIGASDYAIGYYSLNDSVGDYQMKYFSIDRDKKNLIPFIKAAMAYQPKLKIWGSPWTPPSWMKTNHNYFQGNLSWDKKTLDAYALYFAKYIQSYQNEGIDVRAIHVQNEPLHLPTFPSCGWTGQQMTDFIANYLGPEFERSNLSTEIWLGTINGNEETNEFDQYVNTALTNGKASKFITGCGFQWYGNAAVDQTIATFPNKKIMQTETKCGSGENDWNYAFDTFEQMYWYLTRNAVAYMQWNMVLDQSGMSSWGWKQNAMVSIDTTKAKVTYNPQYYMVAHFSRFVKPGAKRIECTVNDELKPIAFQNPDGSFVCILYNRSDKPTKVDISFRNEIVKLDLKPKSINTVLLKNDIKEN